MRLKTLKINPALMVGIFQNGIRHKFEVINGLPVDARLTNVVWDFPNRMGYVVLTIESQEFEELPEGVPIPEIVPEFRNIEPAEVPVKLEDPERPTMAEEADEAVEVIKAGEATELEIPPAPPEEPSCDHEDSGYGTTSSIRRGPGGNCLKRGEKKKT